MLSYLAAVTITGDSSANLDQCLALTALALRVLPTHAATWDLGLYGLIRKTGSHGSKARFKLAT
jgi:hypothetical protein